jgi:hypothetical protein
MYIPPHTSLYDDSLFVFSKTVLSVGMCRGKSLCRHSFHCFPELKENQKLRFGQTAGPKNQSRNSITFKPRIELQRAQVEAAVQPAFCFYKATIIIIHTA